MESLGSIIPTKLSILFNYLLNLCYSSFINAVNYICHMGFYESKADSVVVRNTEALATPLIRCDSPLGVATQSLVSTGTYSHTNTSRDKCRRKKKHRL